MVERKVNSGGNNILVDIQMHNIICTHCTGVIITSFDNPEYEVFVLFYTPGENHTKSKLFK